MNTYTDTSAPEFANAKLGDIIVNGYGEQRVIIDETPKGRLWITQSLAHPNIRSTAFKYDASRAAIVGVTA